MIPSAIDQRTSVLPNRKIKTERGVDGFVAAARSSVSAIRAPSERRAAKASAEPIGYPQIHADERRFLFDYSGPFKKICVNLQNLRTDLEQDCTVPSLLYFDRREQNDASPR